MEQVKITLISRLLGLVLKKHPNAFNQIDSLDGLRGIAVLFVLVSHLSNAGMHIIPPLSFSGVGKVGVWLFFTLSSFLLTLQFLNKKDGSLISARVWLNYFVRRFFRIYPLFTLVMLISWMFSNSGYFFMDGTNDLISRLLLQEAKGVEWSILVEFRYYMVLPIMVLLMVFPLKRKPIFVTAVALLAVVTADFYRPEINLVSLRPYISIFIMGSYTAYIFWLFRQRFIQFTIKEKWAFELIAAAIVVVLFSLTPSVLSEIIGQSLPINYWHEHLTLFSVLWCLFIFSYMNGTGYIASLLSKDWLRAIGIISFGLYLWHPPVIEYVRQNYHTHPSIQACLVLLITFAISYLTYVFVERPFLKIKLFGIS